MQRSQLPAWRFSPSPLKANATPKRSNSYAYSVRTNAKRERAVVSLPVFHLDIRTLRCSVDRKASIFSRMRPQKKRPRILSRIIFFGEPVAIKKHAHPRRLTRCSSGFGASSGFRASRLLKSAKDRLLTRAAQKHTCVFAKSYRATTVGAVATTTFSASC
jgi:hypothetical protein